MRKRHASNVQPWIVLSKTVFFSCVFFLFVQQHGKCRQFYVFNVSHHYYWIRESKEEEQKKKWKICYNLEQFEIELLYIITILNYNNYEIILCLFLKSDPRSHNSIYCFLSFSFCAFFLRSLSLTATQIEKCIIVEYPHLR